APTCTSSRSCCSGSPCSRPPPATASAGTGHTTEPLSRTSKTRHQTARTSKQQSARERVAAQRAAQQRAERRNRVLFAGGSIVLVLAIVAVLVLVKALHHGSPSSNTTSAGGVTGTPLPASVSQQVTGVPAAVLNTVGAGSVPDFLTQTGQQRAVTTV